MIRVYIGTLGTGKTLGMLDKALPFIKKGLPVVTNFPIYVPGKKLTFLAKPSEMFEAIKSRVNTLFLIDEAYAVLDSYNKIDRDVFAMLAHSRKKGNHFYLAAQAFNFIAARMRKIVDEVAECHKNRFPLLKFSQIYFNKEYFEMAQKDRTLEEEKRHIIGRKYITSIYAKKLYKLYDTKYIVQLDDSEAIDINKLGVNLDLFKNP